MSSGARTPEELETLFEDAFVVRDHSALVQLFDEGAVLVTADQATEVRGREEIARVAAAMWGRDEIYLAAPTRILQSRDITLVVADRGINVLRRGSDCAWRFVISLLNIDDTTGRSVP